MTRHVLPMWVLPATEYRERDSWQVVVDGQLAILGRVSIPYAPPQARRRLLPLVLAAVSRLQRAGPVRSLRDVVADAWRESCKGLTPAAEGGDLVQLTVVFADAARVVVASIGAQRVCRWDEAGIADVLTSHSVVDAMQASGGARGAALAPFAAVTSAALAIDGGGVEHLREAQLELSDNEWLLVVSPSLAALEDRRVEAVPSCIHLARRLNSWIASDDSSGGSWLALRRDSG